MGKGEVTDGTQYMRIFPTLQTAALCLVDVFPKTQKWVALESDFGGDGIGDKLVSSSFVSSACILSFLTSLFHHNKFVCACYTAVVSTGTTVNLLSDRTGLGGSRTQTAV